MDFTNNPTTQLTLLHQSINQIMANLIADNCLFFLSSEYDKDDKNSVLCIINEFYSPDELISAKKTLIIECEKLGISDSITKYKSSRQLSKGDGIQKVIRDLVDIWSVIDLQKGGKTISTFVVDNPKRLPPTDNNSHNFRQLFSLFSHMQKQVTDIGNIVTHVSETWTSGNLVKHVFPKHGHQETFLNK